MLTHIAAIAQPTCSFDAEPQQDEADIVVSATVPRLEVGVLVNELRQEVRALEDSVARLVSPQVLVVLAGFLIRVITDP